MNCKSFLNFYPTKTKTNISLLEPGNRHNEIYKHLSLVRRYYSNLKDFLSIANNINLTLREPLDEKRSRRYS